MQRLLHFSVVLSAIASTLSPLSAQADDTELYVASNTGTQHARVLILFDNSGSMTTEDVQTGTTTTTTTTPTTTCTSNGNGRGNNNNQTCTTTYTTTTTTTPVYSTRLAVAQEAITNVINSSSNVDWGLAVFNKGATYDSTNTSIGKGGRIARAVESASDTSSTTDTDDSLKSEILTAISNITANTTTPLSESTYEILRYFSGSAYRYGKWATTSLPYDANAFTSSGTNYNSPLSQCNYKGYLIIVTDGEPNESRLADSVFRTNYLSSLSSSELTSFGTCYNFSTKATTTDSSTCTGSNYSLMPAMAGYMKNKDLLTSTTGTQTVTTYTIGFGSEVASSTKAQNLLTETASRGGGSFYSATDPSGLASALTSILVNINQEQNSMVSVATTGSATDKTQYEDSLYYTEFLPSSGTRWTGNIKKLKYHTDSSGSSYVADANDAPAFTSSGKLQSTAKTYWSSVVDGDSITKGGVQQMIANKSSRTLYVNNGTSGTTLQTLNESNLTSIAGSAANLKSALGLASTSTSTELTSMVNWILGKDVDSENTTSGLTYRETVFGDMMHSQPLVINYGKRNSSSTDDIRLLVGTNPGFIHMFKDSDSSNSVDESWAFVPYSLIGNQYIYRTNTTTSTHTYGIDNTPVSYTVDANNDGIIDPSSSSSEDKAWAFITERQGGKDIIAMNISNPDSPSIKWIIQGGTTSGFSRLGYTWSKPRVGKVKTTSFTGPVLIFGGGYDTNKDTTGVGTDDSIGNAIYIVDADTGGSNFKFVISPDSTANIRKTGMTDSIPAQLTTLDSDGDGYIDRIYAPDTGGNIWRVDTASTSTSSWSAYKFASLGGTSTTTDRRIFGAPVVVYTVNNKATATSSTYSSVSTKKVAFDAVMVGTGDRNKPTSETSVSNYYYMLRDYNVTPFTNTSSVPSDSSAITESSLYDITDNPLGTATAGTAAYNQILVNLTNSSGWKYQMTDTGEKVFGNGTVVDGTLYFTSYTPPSSSTSTTNTCDLSNIGTTTLYSMNLLYGTSVSTKTYSNLLVEDLETYVSSNDHSISILGVPGDVISTTSTSGSTSSSTTCSDGTCYSGQTSTSGSTNPVMQFQYQEAKD